MFVENRLAHFVVDGNAIFDLDILIIDAHGCSILMLYLTTSILMSKLSCSNFSFDVKVKFPDFDVGFGFSIAVNLLMHTRLCMLRLLLVIMC